MLVHNKTMKRLINFFFWNFFNCDLFMYIFTQTSTGVLNNKQVQIKLITTTMTMKIVGCKLALSFYQIWL